MRLIKDERDICYAWYYIYDNDELYDSFYLNHITKKVGLNLKPKTTLKFKKQLKDMRYIDYLKIIDQFDLMCEL